MMLPGFSSSAPALPRDPPPPVKTTDPAIAASKKKLRESELRRKGRRSTIVTGGAGVTSDAPLSQPKAGGSILLGG